MPDRCLVSLIHKFHPIHLIKFLFWPLAHPFNCASIQEIFFFTFDAKIVCEHFMSKIGASCSIKRGEEGLFSVTHFGFWECTISKFRVLRVFFFLLLLLLNILQVSLCVFFVTSWVVYVSEVLFILFFLVLGFGSLWELEWSQTTSPRFFILVRVRVRETT